MMALNIAVPMSGVGDLLEGFGLLSPISPVSIDFRSSIKNPLSPVGSESSGVSSLDLEDIKKQMPSSPTLLDDNEEEGSSSSGRPEKSSSNSSSLSAGSTISTTSSRTCSTSSSSSSSSSSSTASDDETNQLDEKLPENANENDGCGGGDAGASILSASPTASPGAAGGKESDEPPTSAPIDDADALLAKSSELLSLTKEEPLDQLLFLSPKPTKEPIYSLPRQSIYYNNRDILDLGSNLRAQGGGGGAGGLSGEFAFQYAVLPDTNNIQFFLQNRSQYHRLGPNGHVQEFRMATCACCDFKYPVNTVGANATAAPVSQSCATLNLSNLNANQIYGNLQQQQQQQQQQQIQLQQQQRLRCMQYQQQQYNYRASAGVGNSNNSMGRDYNMYQSGNGGAAAAAGGVVPSSSRFNNGIYGSGAVAGASSPNAQGGGGMAAGGSSAGNGGFFNNNALMGRDQFNPMVSMTMQYNNHNNSGANPKGISQSNGGASSLSSAAALRQQQQYELSQQQKQQYVNNYSLGAGANAANNTASSAAVRLQQQQQQSQQSSHYYKKNQSMRYGGPTGLNANMMSSGPAGSSNWKNSMTNNAIQDTAAKLFMELNKMQQQQQQQQQQSPYYVPFL